MRNPFKNRNEADLSEEELSFLSLRKQELLEILVQDKRELERLTEEKQRQEREIAGLREALEDSRRRLEEMQMQEKLSEEYEKAVGMLALFDGTNGMLQNSLTAVEEMHTAMQDSCRELEQTHESLQESFREMNQTHETVRDSLREMDQIQEGMEQTLAAQAEKNTDLQSRVEALDKSRDELHRVFGQIRDGMEDSLKKADQTIEHLKTGEASLTQAEQLTESLKELQRSMTEKLEDLAVFEAVSGRMELFVERAGNSLSHMEEVMAAVDRIDQLKSSIRRTELITERLEAIAEQGGLRAEGSSSNEAGADFAGKTELIRADGTVVTLEEIVEEWGNLLDEHTERMKHAMQQMDRLEEVVDRAEQVAEQAVTLKDTADKLTNLWLAGEKIEEKKNGQGRKERGKRPFRLF